jgi:hypothetical protein
VSKHVLICVSFFVFGSYNAAWRTELSIGKALADGWLDPFLQ